MKIRKRKNSKKRRIVYIFFIIAFLCGYGIGLNQLYNCIHTNLDDMTYFPRINSRIKEELDRGIVALYTEEGWVYVGWRFLEGDSPDISFN